MSTKPKPSWLAELERKLEQPYTPEELAHIRESFARADEIKAGVVWPAGTFDRLLEMARAEDEDPDE